MIRIEKALNSEIEINKAEVLRYLGYKKNDIQNAPHSVIKECIGKVTASAAYKACYDKFPISLPGGSMLDLGFMSVSSKSLAKNLSCCNEIILFTATIGIETDRLIQKYSALSPVYAVVLQAVGAAAIESWCNELNFRFAEREQKNKHYLRPRFSPGYGDLPLNMQKDIFRVLDCSRKIGVTLTDSLMMLPTKSVSAIIGLSDCDSGCVPSGCESCKKTDCLFRRNVSEDGV